MQQASDWAIDVVVWNRSLSGCVKQRFLPFGCAEPVFINYLGYVIGFLRQKVEVPPDLAPFVPWDHLETSRSRYAVSLKFTGSAGTHQPSRQRFESR